MRGFPTTTPRIRGRGSDDLTRSLAKLLQTTVDRLGLCHPGGPGLGDLPWILAGLALAREIYAEAFAHRDELCQPYAAVIDISYANLPAPDEVRGWTSSQYTAALRHDPSNPAFNADLRQLLHVGFKVAAKMASWFL